MTTSADLTTTTYHLMYWISNDVEPDNTYIETLLNEDAFVNLVSLANQHWLVGAFAQGIKNKHCWHLLPIIHQAYLNDITSVYTLRAEELADETINAVKILNTHNITPILLKGAATLFNGVAMPKAIRFMSDIDLLVPPEQLTQSMNAMLKNAYIQYDNEYDVDKFEHHHATPLKREHSKCYIEIHRWYVKKNLLSVLSNESIWQQASRLTLEQDLLAKELSPTHQIIFNIVHSELADRGYFEQQINLFQLTNLYQLLTFYRSDVQWQIIQAAFKKVGLEKVLFARLVAIETLYQFTIPLSFDRNKSKSIFDKCLQQHIKSKGGSTFWAVLKGQLSEYSKLAIRVNYGETNFYAIQKARFKVLTTQFKKLFNKNYLKKFCQANFQKDL